MYSTKILIFVNRYHILANANGDGQVDAAETRGALMDADG